jgi:mRNA interferase MazF
VVQADELLLSTLLVAPTSRSAVPQRFRPTVSIEGEDTQVLLEQTSAVSPERLGEAVGHVSRDELESIDAALRLVLQLD